MVLWKWVTNSFRQTTTEGISYVLNIFSDSALQHSSVLGPPSIQRKTVDAIRSGSGLIKPYCRIQLLVNLSFHILYIHIITSVNLSEPNIMQYQLQMSYRYQPFLWFQKSQNFFFMF